MPRIRQVYYSDSRACLVAHRALVAQKIMIVDLGLSESQKCCVRKKSKLFEKQDGILYYKDQKSGKQRQVIRDKATRRQVLFCFQLGKT